jgi:hypothetical protein
MRVTRWVLLVAGIGCMTLVGCGRKTRTKKHSPPQSEPSALLVPTPDNTPIAPLRTPAGLVLKAGPEATATPSPGAAGASAKAAS